MEPWLLGFLTTQIARANKAYKSAIDCLFPYACASSDSETKILDTISSSGVFFVVN